MSASLVGSEMCIRDRDPPLARALMSGSATGPAECTKRAAARATCEASPSRQPGGQRSGGGQA
eukprot:2086694-Alexandrium_andersonii.AAC.1